MDASIFPGEVSDIISGVVIYLCAFSLLFRNSFKKMFDRIGRVFKPAGKEESK